MSKKTGKSARAKGHRYERAVAELLRIYGWEARTAREADLLLDAAGVDIATNAPFNIQCKHQERLTSSLHKLLNEMPRDKVPVVFHKKNNQGSIVAMRISDFCDLLLAAHSKIHLEHPIYDSQRTDSST